MILWTPYSSFIFFKLWCPLRIPHNNDVRFVFTSRCLYEGSCLISVICVCLRIVVSNTYSGVLCFWFVCLRHVYPNLPVSLDCSYLIVHSVFSNVYLPVSLDCPYLIAPSVFSNVYLPLSLDCPYLIAPSVFSNVYYLQRILNNVKNKEQIKTAFCTLHLCNSIITIQNLR
jgi:hypothetical protein